MRNRLVVVVAWTLAGLAGCDFHSDPRFENDPVATAGRSGEGQGSHDASTPNETPTDTPDATGMVPDPAADSGTSMDGSVPLIDGGQRDGDLDTPVDEKPPETNGGQKCG